MKITIRKKIFEQEFFKEQLAKSTSFTSLAKALNFNFCNGVLNKDLKDAVKRLGLNTDHFSLGGNTRKYPLVKKNCPVCNNEFVVAKGSQKEETTCSRSCSNTYFHELRYSEEINTKRGKSTKEAISNLIKVVKVQNISDEKPKKIKNTKDYIKYERECLFCKNIFIVNKSDGRIYCSKECVNKCPIHKNKLRQLALERIANGTHKGWSKRDNLEPSYPEKYIIKLLAELNFQLELVDGYITNQTNNIDNVIITRESKVDKWFIDFADRNRKLALEIDGKQHDYPERKMSDKLKDEYLISEGWKILRIRWKKVDKDYREYLIKNISEFFK